MSLVGLLVAGGATAATPATYRTKVNGICRGYTPALKKLAKQMDQAYAAKDYEAWGLAVGKFLNLGLAQDGRIAAVSARFAPSQVEADFRSDEEAGQPRSSCPRRRKGR
jgi:hypothetical protein